MRGAFLPVCRLHLKPQPGSAPKGGRGRTRARWRGNFPQQPWRKREERERERERGGRERERDRGLLPPQAPSKAKQRETERARERERDRERERETERARERERESESEREGLRQSTCVRDGEKCRETSEDASAAGPPRGLGFGASLPSRPAAGNSGPVGLSCIRQSEVENCHAQNSRKKSKPLPILVSLATSISTGINPKGNRSL